MGPDADATPATPPATDSARAALLGQLQTAFQRLDLKGAGAAPTAKLLQALRTLLASQTASLRASQSWAGGLRQICGTLEAQLEEARLSDQAAVDHLATSWNGLLALSEEVHA